MSTHLTWDEVKSVEPGLEALEAAVRKVGSVAAVYPHFCTTDHWLDWVKPILSQFVGWNRGKQALEPEPSADPDARLFTFVDIANMPKAPRPEAETDAERWLRTSTAYSLVYETLYELMPDCDHDGTCGFPEPRY